PRVGDARRETRAEQFVGDCSPLPRRIARTRTRDTQSWHHFHPPCADPSAQAGDAAQHLSSSCDAWRYCRRGCDDAAPAIYQALGMRAWVEDELGQSALLRNIMAA